MRYKLGFICAELEDGETRSVHLILEGLEAGSDMVGLTKEDNFGWRQSSMGR